MKRRDFYVIFEVGQNGRMPTRIGEAAGLDLYAAEDFRLWSREGRLIRLDIKSQFTPGWVGLIWDRSGMGSQDIHRHCGVIDSDYRGEWKVYLRNHRSNSKIFKKGDRIAQVLFQPVWTGLPVAGIVNETDRGQGGFGSTGT
jgi:dUTP pyrophosphatase